MGGEGRGGAGRERRDKGEGKGKGLSPPQSQLSGYVTEYCPSLMQQRMRSWLRMVKLPSRQQSIDTFPTSQHSYAGTT
jgi:hypothetical protein